MGHALRPLVQRRASSQRHPLRDPGATSRRPGSRLARRAPRNLSAGTSGRAKAMEPFDPELDTGGRGDPQPGAGHRGSGGDHTNRAFRFDRRACFPVPTWQRPGHGAQRRGREERSHPEPRTARFGARAWRGWRAPDLPGSEHLGTLNTSRQTTPSQPPSRSERSRTINHGRYELRATTCLTLTGGVVVALTGFGPEEWFAHVVHSFNI